MIYYTAKLSQPIFFPSVPYDQEVFGARHKNTKHKLSLNKVWRKFAPKLTYIGVFKTLITQNFYLIKLFGVGLIFLLVHSTFIFKQVWTRFTTKNFEQFEFKVSKFPKCEKSTFAKMKKKDTSTGPILLGKVPKCRGVSLVSFGTKFGSTLLVKILST